MNLYKLNLYKFLSAAISIILLALMLMVLYVASTAHAAESLPPAADPSPDQTVITVVLAVAMTLPDHRPSALSASVFGHVTPEECQDKIAELFALRPTATPLTGACVALPLRAAPPLEATPTPTPPAEPKPAAGSRA